jgi:uncharacterized OB-fold protein
MMRVPSYWRESPRRYRLIGFKCKKCGKIYFPAKRICAKCGAREFEEIKLSEKGRLITYTVIRSPPSQFEKYVPYIVGIIELEGGGRVLSQIVDSKPEEVKMGMEVELVFRRVTEEGEAGIVKYGYKFRPVAPSAKLGA